MSPVQVFDRFLPEALFQEVDETFPLPNDVINIYKDQIGRPTGWVRYDNPVERKWANNSSIPPAVSRGLAHLATRLTDTGWDEAIPDLTLYGAGCHVMGRGDHLDLHLDADVHPTWKLERASNAILFLDDWRDEWNGAFELWNFQTDPNERLARVYPRRNRLLLFDTSDVSVHGVPEPLACPEGVFRRTLVLYWWRQPGPRFEPKRQRALFLPRPGEFPNPELDHFRQERSRIQ